MYNLPQSIEIDGTEYPIRNGGDFRLVLDCFDALNDSELSKEERLLATLIIFYEHINTMEDLLNIEDLEPFVSEMFKFFRCGQEESPSKPNNHRLIDWSKDSQLICAAVNNVAKQEVRLESFVHWWTFMGYFNSIGESSLSTVVSIRNKIIKGKKLEKHERQFRLDNPNYFNWNFKSTSEYDEEELIKELWNSKGG